MSHRTRMVALAALVTTCAVAASPALAQEDRFAIRFGIVSMFPSGDNRVDDGMGGTQSIDLDESFGGEFDFEWYFTKRFGLEGAILTVFDADWDVDDDNDIVTAEGFTVTPITVGLNWHPIRNEAVDWSIGVLAGTMFFSDFDYERDSGGGGTSVNGEVRTDSDTTYGFQSAADFAVTKNGKWAVNVGIKYLKSEFDADILEPGTGSRMAKLKVDPWFLRVAGVFRF